MGLKRIRLRLAIHPSLLSHLTEGELQKHNYRRKFDVIVAHNKYNAASRFSSPVKYFNQKYDRIERNRPASSLFPGA
jgi:hypothetical protein